MTEFGSFEAKTYLSELLERAARGEQILITKMGERRKRSTRRSIEPFCGCPVDFPY